MELWQIALLLPILLSCISYIAFLVFGVLYKNHPDTRTEFQKEWDSMSELQRTYWLQRDAKEKREQQRVKQEEYNNNYKALQEAARQHGIRNTCLLYLCLAQFHGLFEDGTSHYISQEHFPSIRFDYLFTFPLEQQVQFVLEGKRRLEDCRPPFNLTIVTELSEDLYNRIQENREMHS